MTKQVTKLEPGQAEHLVRNIRQHTHESDVHAQHKRWDDEEKERQTANDFLEILLDGLKRKFNHYAWKFFGNKPHCLIEDLIQEMVIRTIKEVRRTDKIPHTLFYEQNFRLAIESCINNVLDNFNTKNAGYNDSPTRAYLQEQKERKKEGVEDRIEVNNGSNYSSPLSLNFSIEGDDGTSQQQDFVPDPAALRAVQDVLTDEVWNAFLTELTPITLWKIMNLSFSSASVWKNKAWFDALRTDRFSKWHTGRIN